MKNLSSGDAQAWSRRRGFNIQEKFIAGPQSGPFREQDFALVAEWGFDFVRLPLSYRCWSDPRNWRQLDEAVLREIDQAVAWGCEYGIHVSLNFHRAPGYSVNRTVAEPFSLWTDSEALEACAHHWTQFALRYRHVPAAALSFDLINEPAMHAPGSPRLVERRDYDRVLDALLGAIRAVDEQRPIVIEGGLWGTLPLPWRRGPGVVQSLHCYAPMQLTHWRSTFLEPAPDWPEPRWPLPIEEIAAEGATQRDRRVRTFYSDEPPDGTLDANPAAPWDRARLARHLAPWRSAAMRSVPIHAGEFGVDQHTPHPVALAWMRDALAEFRSAGWGWALWQLRGPFGVLDSARRDVAYEGWRGHRLDRAMLELLRSA